MRVKVISQQQLPIEPIKLHSNAQKIFNFYEQKYFLGAVGLIKACASASIKIKKSIPLNVMTIAPSRQYKSQTTNHLSDIFKPTLIEHLGSDFTIHSLMEEYKEGKKLNHKTCSVNDLTLLLASKNQQARSRLINGMAELLSDGLYSYSDRISKLRLKARINLLTNITYESYSKNQDTLIENTFGERMLKIFYEISSEKQKVLADTKIERMQIKWNPEDSIKILPVDDIIIERELYKNILEKTIEWKIFTQSTNVDDLMDKTLALVKGYTLLDGRNTVIKEDISILDIAMPYLQLKSNKTYQIQTYYLQGKTPTEIIHALGYNEKGKSFVYRCIKKLKDRGVTI